VTDSSGRRLAYIDYPFMLFEKVEHVLENQPLNYVIICFSLAVILLTLLFWPIAAILRKHYDKPLTLDPRALRSRRLAHIACFIALAFLIGVALLANGLGTPGGLGSHGDTRLHLLQFVGVLSALGALLAIYNGIVSWRDAQQWRWYKIWNLMLAVACVSFFWFLAYWHLLNFDLNY